MPNTSNTNNRNDSIKITGSVDYFIYNVQHDLLNLSDNTRRFLGVANNDICTLSSLKSQIIGVDIPVFISQLNKWLDGDSSNIIQVRIIDYKNQMRTIQIKGHVRLDSNNKVKSIYGAYFDISIMGN